MIQLFFVSKKEPTSNYLDLERELVLDLLPLLEDFRRPEDFLLELVPRFEPEVEELELEDEDEERCLLRRRELRWRPDFEPDRDEDLKCKKSLKLNFC